MINKNKVLIGEIMANKLRRVFFLTKEEEIKEQEKFIEEIYNKHIKDRKNGSIKIYSMIYDSKEYGNNGYGDYLGEFKRIKQLREDAWVDDFIGVNTKTEEVCLILSREVCGYGGGIAYEVIPIPELMLK